MNKGVAVVLMGGALLSATGCATKGYVRSELDPVAERLSRLEAAVAQLADKIGTSNGSLSAERAAVQRADEKAQRALEAAEKANSGVTQSAEDAAKSAEAAASRAEASAKEAEGAAKEAEKVEGKSEKIFKLEQKK